MRFTRNAFRVEEHTLRLTKVGAIPITYLEPGTAGGYCASFVGAAVEHPALETRGQECRHGSGLGIPGRVTPEGEMIAPPRFLRSPLQRIWRLSRDPSRKVKGSGNRQKARRRLARAHVGGGPMAGSSPPAQHRRIGENQTVVLEDLNVWGMAKNHKPARAIAAGGWLLLRRLLASKAEMYGREVKVISRWLPTKDGKKALSVRARRCSACGTEQDREVNAAGTILAAVLVER